MKIRILRFCFLVSLFVPILLAGQENSGNEKEAKIFLKLRLTQPLLNKAFDLLAAKDWEGAAGQFNRCLETLPEHPNACFGMAEIFNQKGDFATALTWIEKAEKGCLYLSQIWTTQKLSLFRLSQEEQDQLLQIAFDLSYLHAKGVCRAAKYDRESKGILQKVKNVSTKRNTADSPFAIPTEFFALHGNLQFKLKRFEEAEAQYLQALAIAPDHERCLNNLINIYFISNKIEQARSWLEKATQQQVNINPGLIQAMRQAKIAEKPQNTP